MLAINFIACAWCVLLTLVSAADVPYLHDDYQKSLQKDFDEIGATHTDFKSEDYWEEYLKFSGRTFPKLMFSLNLRDSCDERMRSDLVRLKEIISPPIEPSSSTFRKSMHGRFIERLQFCRVHLEIDEDVIDFMALPWVKEIEKIKQQVMVFTQRECGMSDQYCYKKGMDCEKFTPIAALIFRPSLNAEGKVDMKKLELYAKTKTGPTFEVLKSTNLFEFVPILSEHGNKLGPKVDMIMYSISLFRLLDKNNPRAMIKLVNHQREMEGAETNSAFSFSLRAGFCWTMSLLLGVWCSPQLLEMMLSKK